MKDEFYIGYEAKSPASYSRFTKRLIPLLFLGILIIGFLLVKSQKGFSTATFELGKVTELEGTLTMKPVPMLTTKLSNESILLIDYGKFGAEKTLLDLFKDETIESLDVKLAGTLIYGDGKTLMELTKGKKSILETKPVTHKISEVALGRVELIGEIVDPKCYFGVMKSGEGKVHRSCAIRCISGGIPPVLKVSNDKGESNYFVLRGSQGQQINQQVLDYVAEPVKLSGELLQFNNWMILNMDEEIGIERLL